MILVEINGKTKPVGTWIRELGLNKNSVFTRINNGWNPADAITTPFAKRGVYVRTERKGIKQQREFATKLKSTSTRSYGENFKFERADVYNGY
jgi:hypothetical protein